jgi:hypothetical protein
MEDAQNITPAHRRIPPIRECSRGGQVLQSSWGTVRDMSNEPPSPGGDPDQPPSDLPKPPAHPDTDETKGRKSGFGHIGNKDVPRPEGAPPPHQIF